MESNRLKKAALMKVKADLESRDCALIELVWSGGLRTGISNKEAIATAKKALLGELERQISELDTTN